MHHYPFHPGDHKLDAGHLSLEEDATYRRALDFYYVSEAPLPDDKPMLCKRLGVKEKTLSSVLGEFFILRDDGWHHARCDAEIAKYQAKAVKARQVGTLGGRPPKKTAEPVRLSDGTQKEPARSAEGNRPGCEQKANHQPEPSTKHTPSIPQGGGGGEDFEGEQEDQKQTGFALQDPVSEPQRWNPTPQQLQVSGWFDRRPTTPWSPKELRTWKAIVFDDEDMEILDWFYLRSGCDYLRRDLQTLLNNWRGKVDRARNFANDEEDES